MKIQPYHFPQGASLKGRALAWLQVSMLLPILPFEAVRYGAKWIAILFDRTLYRGLWKPAYVAIVRAKRRELGEPLWQPQDMMIGVLPPPGFGANATVACSECGETVPGNGHGRPSAHFRTCAGGEGCPPGGWGYDCVDRVD